MAENLIRAQTKPAAGVWGRLLDVNNPTTLSTIRACNVGVVQDQAYLRVALGGAAEEDAQLLAHRLPIPPGLVYSMTEGVTLIEGDVIWVKSVAGSLAFHVFGVETT